MQQVARVGVKRLVQWQLLLWGILLMLSALIGQSVDMLTTVLAGLCVLIPAWVFMFKTFQYSGAQKARQIVRAFYLGEGIKIALTVVLCTGVFMTTQVNAALFFIDFVLLLSLNWLSPLMFRVR